MGSLEIKNEGQADITKVVSFSKEVSTGYEWDFDQKGGVELGTTFNTGLPYLFEGKISSKLSLSESISYGTKHSERTTVKTEDTYVTKPGELIKVESAVFLAKMKVPYTVCNLKRRGNWNAEWSCTEGTWECESTLKTKTTVTRKPFDDDD